MPNQQDIKGGAIKFNNVDTPIYTQEINLNNIDPFEFNFPKNKLENFMEKPINLIVNHEDRIKNLIPKIGENITIKYHSKRQLKRYKRRLRRYKKWSKKTRKKYGNRPTAPTKEITYTI